MPKHYLVDPIPDSRPHRSKQQRKQHQREQQQDVVDPLLEMLPQPATYDAVGSHSANLPLPGDKTTREHALDTLARYDEMERLFSTQFPGLNAAGFLANGGGGGGSFSDFQPRQRQPPIQQRLSRPSFLDQASASSSSGTNDYSNSSSPDTMDDFYDPDHELELELNTSMGLVWRVPSQPQLDSMTVPGMTAPSFPSIMESRSDGYPFTSPTGGEVMVGASPADASFSGSSRPPPNDNTASGVVEDLGWFGEQLQRNARQQLQTLREST